MPTTVKQKGIYSLKGVWLSYKGQATSANELLSIARKNGVPRNTAAVRLAHINNGTSKMSVVEAITLQVSKDNRQKFRNLDYKERTNDTKIKENVRAAIIKEESGVEIKLQLTLEEKKEAYDFQLQTGLNWKQIFLKGLGKEVKPDVIYLVNLAKIEVESVLYGQYVRNKEKYNSSLYLRASSQEDAELKSEVLKDIKKKKQELRDLESMLG